MGDAVVELGMAIVHNVAKKACLIWNLHIQESVIVQSARADSRQVTWASGAKIIEESDPTGLCSFFFLLCTLLFSEKNT